MFELAWSKVLIIAIAAIVVVGPKDLPMVLRTLGRYLGYLRRQADEFKQQFNEALREAELDSVKKEFEDIKKTTEESMRGIEQTVDETVKSAGHIADDINRPFPQASKSEELAPEPLNGETPAIAAEATSADHAAPLANGSAHEGVHAHGTDPAKPGA